ncbi:FlmC-like protein (plasmid) [Phytobacter sp. AG2a]|jgi:hypothetical protein
MTRHQQISRLPAVRQGEVSYEGTTELFHLVCLDRVYHAPDIHLADAKIALRNSLQRRKQGGGRFNGLRIR